MLHVRHFLFHIEYIYTCNNYICKVERTEETNTFSFRYVRATGTVPGTAGTAFTHYLGERRMQLVESDNPNSQNPFKIRATSYELV